MKTISMESIILLYTCLNNKYWLKYLVSHYCFTKTAMHIIKIPCLYKLKEMIIFIDTIFLLMDLQVKNYCILKACTHNEYHQHHYKCILFHAAIAAHVVAFQQKLQCPQQSNTSRQVLYLLYFSFICHRQCLVKQHDNSRVVVTFFSAAHLHPILIDIRLCYHMDRAVFKAGATCVAAQGGKILTSPKCQNFAIEYIFF